jgi:hypothetical protein
VHDVRQGFPRPLLAAKVHLGSALGVFGRRAALAVARLALRWAESATGEHARDCVIERKTTETLAKHKKDTWVSCKETCLR